jgi:hypothetical protein
MSRLVRGSAACRSIDSTTRLIWPLLDQLAGGQNALALSDSTWKVGSNCKIVASRLSRSASVRRSALRREAIDCQIEVGQLMQRAGEDRGPLSAGGGIFCGHTGAVEDGRQQRKNNGSGTLASSPAVGATLKPH